MSSHKKKKKKKKHTVKCIFQVISIPENEEDMRRLIREIKQQATIYRSLCKHWSEVANQVRQEINRFYTFISSLKIILILSYQIVHRNRLSKRL